MAAVCGHQSRWIAPTAASSSSSSASEILSRAAHVRARPSLLQLPRSLGWLCLSLSLSLFLFFSLLFVDCIRACSLHWNSSRHRLQNNDYQKLLTFTCFWGFVCLFFWMPQLVRGLSDKEQKTWGNKSISLGSWICGW